MIRAQLSERDLLLRARDAAQAALEVARFVASLATDAGAPAELESVVAVALRAVARSLGSGTVTAGNLDSLAVVVAAARPYASLRPLVATAVLGVDLSAASEVALRELLRLALAADPSATTASSRGHRVARG